MAKCGCFTVQCYDHLLSTGAVVVVIRVVAAVVVIIVVAVSRTALTEMS